MWVLDQALRRRKCKECKAAIPPNYFHLAVWSNKMIRVGNGHITITTRSNICLACVEKYAEDLKIRNYEQNNINNGSTPVGYKDLPF